MHSQYNMINTENNRIILYIIVDPDYWTDSR